MAGSGDTRVPRANVIPRQAEGLDEGSVRAELARILGSADFRASARLRRFLEFVVDESLAGRASRLKGYAVAISVLGRPPDFDPATDAIVRVEARRLRTALEGYYLKAGAESRLRIEIPKGTYAPRFAPKNAAGGEALAREHVRTPRLAVLPLSTGSGASAREFGVGLSAALLTAMDTAVMVRVFPFESDESSERSRVMAAGRKIDADFALSGCATADRTRIRATVRLLDARTGEQVWARNYDRSLDGDALTLQQEIALSISADVADPFGGALHEALHSRAVRPRKVESHYELAARMNHYTCTGSRAAYEEALRAVDVVLDRDPGFARGWAMRGGLLTDGFAHGFKRAKRAEVVAQALASCHRALQMDPSCESAYWNLGTAYLVARDPEGARRSGRWLIERTGPPSCQAMGAWLVALAGDWEHGIPILRKKIAAARTYPRWFHHAPFLYHYQRAEYAEALDEARRFETPSLIWGDLERAASLSRLGRIEDARRSLDELRGRHPQFSEGPQRFLSCFIMQDSLIDDLLDALAHAGLGWPSPTALRSA